MAGVRIAAPLVLLLLAAACAAPISAEPTPTGDNVNVTGMLDRGPSPTCPADEPCDPPPVAALLVFSTPGGQMVRTRVQPDGSFALHLAPGEYTITTAPPAFQGKVEPSSVHVPETGAVFLRLHIARAG